MQSSIVHHCQVCPALSDHHSKCKSTVQTSARPSQVRFSISDPQESDSSSPKSFFSDLRSEVGIHEKSLCFSKPMWLLSSWIQALSSQPGTELSLTQAKTMQSPYSGISFSWGIWVFLPPLRPHRLQKLTCYLKRAQFMDHEIKRGELQSSDSQSLNSSPRPKS